MITLRNKSSFCFKLCLIKSADKRRWILIHHYPERKKNSLFLNLYYKHNKTFRQITKEAKISPRDIKTIVDKPVKEKERQENKSVSTQAYELFSQGKKPVEIHYQTKH